MSFKVLSIIIFLILAHAKANEAQSGNGNDAEVSSEPTSTPKALPALALTPQAVMSTVAIAVSLGIISQNESREIALQLEQTIENVNYQMRERIQTIMARLKEHEGNESQRPSGSRVVRCEGGPQVCCKEFFQKFKPERSNGSNAGQTKEHIVKDRNNIACCLQWDFTHGVW